MKTEPKAMTPSSPGKDVGDEFDRFKSFLGRLVAVPHSEIKAQLDADKAKKRRAKTRSASRASGASSKMLT
jgi:hypothetical protein